MKSGAGTYALILKSVEPRFVEVGRIGRINLRAGFYAYIGSAHGPGGLPARVNRHLSRIKTVHWHIDYLTVLLPIIEVWYLFGSQPYEHAWAELIAGMSGAEIAAARFGSSDCRCKTHLYFFPAEPDFSEITRVYSRAERRVMADSA